MVRTGVWMLGGQSVADMVSLSQAAEANGADAVWIADGYFGRDPFVALAAIASATSKILLGTGITSPYLRHPTTLAAAFATLDELSGGRAICGIGSGSRDQLADLGITARSPLGAVRESTQILKSVLSGKRTDLGGSTFTAHLPGLAFRPVRPEIPVIVAAMGPKMCALAGELADGVFLQYGSPDSLAASRAAVEEGLSRRPEPPADFQFAVATMMSVSENRQEAIDRIRSTVGRLLTEPGAEAFLRANGLDPEAAERIRAGLAESGPRAMAAAVDDEIVTRLAVAGTVNDCRKALVEAAGAGADHVIVTIRPEQAELAFKALEALHE